MYPIIPVKIMIVANTAIDTIIKLLLSFSRYLAGCGLYGGDGMSARGVVGLCASGGDGGVNVGGGGVNASDGVSSGIFIACDGCKASFSGSAAKCDVSVCTGIPQEVQNFSVSKMLSSQFVQCTNASSTSGIVTVCSVLVCTGIPHEVQNFSELKILSSQFVQIIIVSPMNIILADCETRKTLEVCVLT